jgi:hypothetical protein
MVSKWSALRPLGFSRLALDLGCRAKRDLVIESLESIRCLSNLTVRPKEPRAQANAPWESRRDAGIVLFQQCCSVFEQRAQ